MADSKLEEDSTRLSLEEGSTRSSLEEGSISSTLALGGALMGSLLGGALIGLSLGGALMGLSLGGTLMGSSLEGLLVGLTAGRLEGLLVGLMAAFLLANLRPGSSDDVSLSSAIGGLTLIGLTLVGESMGLTRGVEDEADECPSADLSKTICVCEGGSGGGVRTRCWGKKTYA
jgi:hypothetical protein